MLQKCNCFQQKPRERAFPTAGSESGQITTVLCEQVFSRDLWQRSSGGIAAQWDFLRGRRPSLPLWWLQGRCFSQLPWSCGSCGEGRMGVECSYELPQFFLNKCSSDCCRPLLNPQSCEQFDTDSCLALCLLSCGHWVMEVLTYHSEQCLRQEISPPFSTLPLLFLLSLNCSIYSLFPAVPLWNGSLPWRKHGLGGFSPASLDLTLDPWHTSALMSAESSSQFQQLGPRGFRWIPVGYFGIISNHMPRAAFFFCLYRSNTTWALYIFLVCPGGLYFRVKEIPCQACLLVGLVHETVALLF